MTASGPAAPSTTDRASALQRAAVIVTLLGDDEAAAILSRFQPEELQTLGRAMCELGEVGPQAIAASIDGFIDSAQAPGWPSQDRTDAVRARMQAAIGPARADNIMQAIAPDRPVASLELARWLAPPVLATLMHGERPQVVAVLLLMLEAEPAARTLALLDGEVQPLVVERIARMGPVGAGAIAMLEAALGQSIEQNFGAAALKMGGAREAADLINNAAGDVGRTVMPAITRRDAALAGRIEAEMFTFAMVLDLDAKDMGTLLREVPGETLIDALASLGEDEREPIFAAMSERAADGVRDDIETRGRVAPQDVAAARRAMIDRARDLGEAGTIRFGTGSQDLAEAQHG